MTFTLHVDGTRWPAHTTEVRDAVRAAIRGESGSPGLGDIVPVAKGNGYGLGVTRLAAEATRLGVDRLAVGTVYEVARAAELFAGDILVMQPWDHRDDLAAARWREVDTSSYAQRVIRTVSEASVMRGLLTEGSDQPIRVVIEGVTSMRRFGMMEPDVLGLIGVAGFQRAVADQVILLEGLALHLPIAMPEVHHVSVLTSSGQAPRNTSGRVLEVHGWSRTWNAALEELRLAQIPIGENAHTLWVSHLDDEELAQVRTLEPTTALQARIGTRLWLGDSGCLTARGTILAVHQIGKRFAVGYRQRKAASDGLLLIVGGGTSHGVALQAPTPAASLRQRAIAAGTGALEAVGRSRSPFLWADKLLWFAEPPHMQVSMLWLPESALREGLAKGLRPPTVGDTLDCRVRHTTALFDAVLTDGPRG